MRTYSFADVHAAINGPGGNVALTGDEAGVAQEGITIEPTGDKNAMTEGADGSWMHTLYVSKSGTVTVRLLHASTVNQQLQAMFNYQSASASRWGQNTITIRDTARGDTFTCKGVAFAKQPAKTYAKDSAVREWTFHCGRIDPQEGSGSPEKG